MKKEEVTVIGATMADLPEVMELCRALNKENGIFDMDDDCTEQTLKRALRGGSNQEGILGVIREDSKIVAMIMLVCTHYWYTQKFHIEELFSYVAPEHRRSSYADALIRFAMHSAEQLGIPLMIGVITNRQLEPKVRLYRRRLGMPAGAFFLWNAEWYNERALNTDLWKHTRKRETVPLPATALGTTTLTPSIMSS